MNYKTYKELNESSIEQWAAELDGKPREGLSKEKLSMILDLGRMESRIEADEDGKFAELCKGWNGVAIINKRLQLHTFSMSKAAQTFMGLLIDLPGEATIALNYFQYRCAKKNLHHIDMVNLYCEIIPGGWFSDDTLREAWEAQKYVSENDGLLNMLDNSAYGKSIGMKV